MTLRTTSLKRQHQAWALLALIGLVAYISLVLALGLGNPLRFFGSHQMRVLLPLVVILRLLAREFRWDGILREEEKKVEKAGGDRQVGSRVPSRPQSPDDEISSGGDCGAVGVRALPSAQHHSTPTPTTYASPVHQSQPQPSTSTASPSLQPPIFDHQPALPPSDETAEALWNRAREMEPKLDPERPIEQCQNYMELVFAAAEGGEVAALARLGELAFRRGAFVEAYFWTTMAKRRLELSEDPDAQWYREIGDMLRNIRRAWTAAGQPPEFENVYENFQEERGELGRAFLRLNNRQEVGPTRAYIRFLAEKGNPDAALFVV